MKINVEPYNPSWKNQFEFECKIVSELLINYQPIIEHIGSTAVENCAAKPIIDILIGFRSEKDLNSIVSIMTQHQYVYYKLYDEEMPFRRFFVKYKNPISQTVFSAVEERNLFLLEKHLVHIHCTIHKNDFWNRHVAFRNYLQNHEDDKIRYSNLKLELSKQEWKDGNEYNDAKNELIKEIEQKALNSYLSK